MERQIRWYRSDRDLSRCGQWDGDCYRSQWYRGLHPDMEWLRLTLEGAGPFHIRICAANRPSEGEAAPVMQGDGSDLLLYGVTGEYLCFSVTPGDKLTGYTLSFPGLSVADLLPGPLQEDAFLRQLLGAYQSGYMDLNQKGDGLPRRLNPRDRSALPGLARWLGAERWLRGGLTADQVLPLAPALARMRGTVAGLRLLAELVAGTSVTIVERAVHPEALSERAWTALCGDTPNAVLILLPPEASSQALRQLGELLDDFVPLGVTYALRKLEDIPFARMDEANLDEVSLEG